MIYHIITKDKWNIIKKSTIYRPSSLDNEGYIHCSYKDQLLKVADAYHRGEKNLLVLCINGDKLGSNLKSEDLFKLNEEYPHIYGELLLKYIESVVELQISPNGDFIQPNLEPISSLLVEQKEWT